MPTLAFVLGKSTSAIRFHLFVRPDLWFRFLHYGTLRFQVYFPDFELQYHASKKSFCELSREIDNISFPTLRDVDALISEGLDNFAWSSKFYCIIIIALFNQTKKLRYNFLKCYMLNFHSLNIRMLRLIICPFQFNLNNI